MRSLLVDLKDKHKFTQKDCDEYMSLNLKAEQGENLSAQEWEQLLFYRRITDDDLDLTYEEAKRFSNLQVKGEYDLLDEKEKEELQLLSEGALDIF